MEKLVDYLEMEVEGDRDGRGEWWVLIIREASFFNLRLLYAATPAMAAYRMAKKVSIIRTKGRQAGRYCY